MLLPAPAAVPPEQMQVPPPQVPGCAGALAGRSPPRAQARPPNPVGRHHSRGGDEPHAPDQGVKADHVGDIVLLVAERVAMQSGGLSDELAVQRFQPGAFRLALSVADLRPLCHPGGGERGQAADRGAGKGREG